MNREKMKAEALYRMKMLKMLDQPIQEFEKEDKLNKSEYGKGILYWLEDEEMEMVKEFEENYGAVVYHVILDQTAYGPMYSFLYVTKYDTEWAQDKQDIRSGQSLSYVINGCINDMGSIGIQPCNGGVRRTW